MPRQTTYYGDTLTSPIPTIPASHRDKGGHARVKSLMGIKDRTGVTMPVEVLLQMAFNAGYEAGAEDAASGELLAEAETLNGVLRPGRQDKAGYCAGGVRDGLGRQSRSAWSRRLKNGGDHREVPSFIASTTSPLHSGSFNLIFRHFPQRTGATHPQRILIRMVDSGSCIPHRLQRYKSFISIERRWTRGS